MIGRVGIRTNASRVAFHSNGFRRYLSTIQLRPEHFDFKEREILVLNKESKENRSSNGSILASNHAPETRISTFKYDNGIEAIHVRQNKVLDMIILPYQGHQIWSLDYYRQYRSSTSSSNYNVNNNNKTHNFEDYHSIGMKSMFDSPNKVNSSDQWGYLTTYGAFFIHCGILAMGAPGDNDKHGLHGEISNGAFDNTTFIDIDEKTNELTFRGIRTDQACFDHSYKFISKHCININPFVANANANNNSNNNSNGLTVDDFRRYGNFENLIKTNVEIENYYTKDLSVMYLAHINFRPELNGQLCYSASKESTV